MNYTVRDDSSEFYQAFKQIPRKSRDYCMVCLRNGGETRLVKPRAFKQFILITKLDYDRCHDNLICYMCERQAYNAFRFFKTAKFAVKLKNLVRMVVSQENVATSTHSFEVFCKKIKKEIDGDFQKVDTELREIRSRSQLLPTEVLLVDTSDMDNSQPTLADTQAEVFIIPDDVDSNSSTASTVSPQEIVILDEEDEPPQTKKSTRKKQKITPKSINDLLDKTAPPGPLYKMAQNQPENEKNVPLMPYQKLLENAPPSGFILHPIVLSTDGSLSVPTLSAQILNDKLVYGTKDVPNLNTSIVSGANLPKALMNVAKDVTISNNGGNIKENVLLNTYFSTEAHERGSKDIVVGDIDVMDKALVNNLMFNRNCVSNQAKKRKDETSVPEGSPLAAVEKHSRIDWEDKIPMDVICHMDATDPNAKPLLPLRPPSPPGMEICDVRSLSHDMKRTIKRPPDENIIDLC